MGEIVELDVQTRLAVPSDRLLEKALASEVQHVVIVGLDPDGNFYFASSDAEVGEVLLLLERAKRILLADID